MSTEDDRHLNDPVIGQALDEMEFTFARLQAARERRDYQSVSLHVGMLAGLTSKIYSRNAHLAGSTG